MVTCAPAMIREAQAVTKGQMSVLTLAGKNPLPLQGGETRTFLEDGDEVIERGHCARQGYATIGFGEATGRIVPALAK